jgi:hypothetical protein
VGDSPDVGVRYAGGSWRNSRRIAWRLSHRAAPGGCTLHTGHEPAPLAAAPGRRSWAALKKEKGARRVGRGRPTQEGGEEIRWACAGKISGEKEEKGKKEGRPGGKEAAGPQGAEPAHDARDGGRGRAGRGWATPEEPAQERGGFWDFPCFLLVLNSLNK